MLSLLPSFCCNSSTTLSALKATIRERFTADAILNQKDNDEENTSCRPHSNVLRFPNVVAIPCNANFRKCFRHRTQVRIFTGLTSEQK